MRTVEALAAVAIENRKKYLETFEDEISEALEGMAEKGEYSTSVDVTDWPGDVIPIIGDQLHEAGLKYSLKFDTVNDVTSAVLFISIRHVI